MRSLYLSAIALGSASCITHTTHTVVESACCSSDQVSVPVEVGLALVGYAVVVAVQVK